MKDLGKQKIISLALGFLLLTIVGASAAPLQLPTPEPKNFSPFKINLPKPQLKVDKIGLEIKSLAQQISSLTQEKTKKMEPSNGTSPRHLTYHSSNGSQRLSNKSSKRSFSKPTTAYKSTAVKTSSRSSTSELSRARRILARYIARYPILRGVQVYIRDCPNNWQGCAYYKQGVILIDPDHTAPLESIIAHEVQHILDWRSDHDIDNNDYHK